MEMLQIFETTILSDVSDHALHLVVVPSRTFICSDMTVHVEKVVEGLALQKLTLPPINASSLSLALATLAAPAVPSAERIAHLMAALQPVPVTIAPAPVITATDKAFGERAAYSDLVPFEQSPIDLESLGNLVVQASGAGIGAYAGFVIAGPTPLLLITIPAGMILCGAAKGIADALEQGLRERLIRFLKGDAREKETPAMDVPGPLDTVN